MKRPMIWAAGCFVFGEITGLLFGMIALWFCAILTMAACIVLYRIYHAERHKGELRRYGRAVLCLSAFLLSGILASCRAVSVQKNQVDFIESSDIKEKVSADGLLIEVGMIEKTSSGWRLHIKTGIREMPECIVYADAETVEAAYFSEAPCRGDVLRIFGDPEVFEHAANPGCYDAFNYWRAENIYGSIRAERIQLLARSKSKLWRAVSGVKYQMKSVLTGNLSEADAGMMSALVLGDSSEMVTDIKQLYQRQGIAHIFAISGLHMSIVGAGLYRILRKLRLPMGIAAAVCTAVIIFYGEICGLRTSAVRAMIMFILSVAAPWIGRTYDALSALSLAAFLLLLPRPYLLMDFAFLMSFGCALFFSMLALKFRNRPYKGKKNQIKNMLTDAGLLYLFNLPVLSWFQYEVPLYSSFLNLIIVPCMGVLYPIGLLGSIAGCFWPWLGGFILSACPPLLWFFEMTARGFELLPLSSIVTGRPSLVLLTIDMAGLVICMLPSSLFEEIKGGRWILMFRYLLLCTSILFIWPKTPTAPEILFLDVGQGDACLVRDVDGSATLIDGGSSSQSNVGTYVLEKVLKYYGIRQLDRVVISHMDDDHMNGIVKLLEDHYPIGELFVSGVELDQEKLEGVKQAAALDRIPVHTLCAGDTFEWGCFQGVCLWPDRTGESEIQDENDCSVVLKLTYENVSVLFTGDVGQEIEELWLPGLSGISAESELSGTTDLLDLSGSTERSDVSDSLDLSDTSDSSDTSGLSDTFGEYQVPVNILKVAHHGSKYSSSTGFLEGFDPDWAVISCGAGNRYGHPHVETIERLQGVNARILQTQNCGAICIQLQASKKEEASVRVSVFKNSAK